MNDTKLPDATKTTPWFRTRSHGFSMEEEQVTRSTLQSVWVLKRDFSLSGKDGFKEERFQIKNSWWHYWPTKEAAVAHLAERARTQIKDARRMIDEAEGFLAGHSHTK